MTYRTAKVACKTCHWTWRGDYDTAVKRLRLHRFSLAGHHEATLTPIKGDQETRS